jgi:type III secretion protein W
MAAGDSSVKPEVRKAADRLIGRLLELAERSWIGPEDLARLVGDLGVRRVEAEIYLLRELADIVRAVPLKVYKDMEQRERLMGGVQQALDDAIRREEEALTAEDGATEDGAA